MASTQQRQQEVITATSQIENQPGKGKKAYFKLIEGVKLFRPEKNKTYRLIFLPWKAGKGNSTGKPGTWVTNRFFPAHHGVGPGDESILCSAKAFGKPCAVCEQFALLRAQGADYKTVLAHLRAKDRELWLIHDTEDSRNPKNLMVWDESIHNFGDAFRSKFNKKQAWRAFADFNQGCIVEVDAKEASMGSTSYVDCKLGIEIEVRKEPLDPWFRKTCESICVDDCLIEHPYAVVKKMVSNTTGAEEEEEETQEEETQEEEQEVEELQEEEEEESSEEEETQEEEEEESESEEEEETEEEEEVEEEPVEEEEEVEEEETVEEEEEEVPEPVKTKPKKTVPKVNNIPGKDAKKKTKK